MRYCKRCPPPPLSFHPFLRDRLKNPSKFSFTASRSRKLRARCPRTLALISIYSDSLYMALCVSTSESVNASVWRSRRKKKKKKKKNPTSTNEIKEALKAAVKTPTGRWEARLPPHSSNFLCRHVNGWLRKNNNSWAE